MSRSQRFLTAWAIVGVLVFAFTLIVRGSSDAGVPDGDSSPSGWDNDKTAPKKIVLTGQGAFTDAAHEAPGIRRHLTLADLPEPAPDESLDATAHVVPRPANAWPIAPKGFQVELYTTNLDNPRLIRFAPNGDLFLAESATGKIKIFRGVDAKGNPKHAPTFG